MPTLRLRQAELDALKELKLYEFEPLGGVLARLIEFYKQHHPDIPKDDDEEREGEA